MDAADPLSCFGNHQWYTADVLNRGSGESQKAHTEQRARVLCRVHLKRVRMRFKLGGNGVVGGRHPQSRVLRSRSVRGHAFKCLSARGRPCTVGQSAETNSMVMIQTILPVCWFMCDVTRREGEERRRGERRSRKRRGGSGTSQLKVSSIVNAQHTVSDPRHEPYTTSSKLCGNSAHSNGKQ